MFMLDGQYIARPHFVEERCIYDFFGGKEDQQCYLNGSGKINPDEPLAIRPLKRRTLSGFPGVSDVWTCV